MLYVKLTVIPYFVSQYNILSIKLIFIFISLILE